MAATITLVHAPTGPGDASPAWAVADPRSAFFLGLAGVAAPGPFLTNQLVPVIRRAIAAGYVVTIGPADPEALWRAAHPETIPAESPPQPLKALGPDWKREQERLAEEARFHAEHAQARIVEQAP